MRKCTFITVAVLLFGALCVRSAVTANTTEVQQGPAPTVEATEVEQIVPWFAGPGTDEPAARPNHPPIDEIPPMPMPETDDYVSVRTDSGSGNGVIYNMLTGETTEVQAEKLMEFRGLAQGGAGGGYNGADGGLGSDELSTRTFGNMTVVSNPGVFPWRMNVKLVARFVDTNGINRWFVCSGTMRDAETILTAGHCVYARTPNGIVINDWAQEVYVYPGWDGVGNQFSAPIGVINNYGFARSEWVGAFTGWTDNGNFDWDCGVVRVDRAAGMLTGWFSWAWGFNCSTNQGRTYWNLSYPAENCPTPGLHTGRTMYFWNGNWDSCPGNQLQINTTGGCLNAGWGGMSGSGAYYMEGSTRYVHAVSSNSNRSTRARYAKQWEDFVIWTNNTVIPAARGSSFDLQPLDVNAGPSTIQAGNSTTFLNHLAANPTNGTASSTWTYRVYLSTNDNISIQDTLLSTQNYTRSFGSMNSFRVNSVQVTIPGNTPAGNYWLGVVYDSSTDGVNGNNDTDGWDAVAITVTSPPPPPPAPTGVSATDGTFTDRVRVTWNSVSGATSYKVYRATSSVGAKTFLGSTSGTTKNDTSATPERIYYYWVKASSANGDSGFSSFNTGYREMAVPTGVSATDGTFADKVRVTWNSVSGATFYTVYRAISSGGAKTTLGVASSPTFDDTTATAGVTFYYWVRATNIYGSSAFSAYNTGWRNLILPTVTITATDPTAKEPSNTGKFKLTRTGSTGSTLIVKIARSGTATHKVDYKKIGGKRKIKAGKTSRNIKVKPIDDLIPEPDETVIITIKPDPAYIVGSPSSAKVVIKDND